MVFCVSALAAVASIALGTESAPASAIVEIAGGRIRLEITGAELAPARERLLSWTKRSAEIVAAYYGEYPMAETHVFVTARAGSGISHGVAFRRDAGVITVSVAPQVSDAELRDDWVLIHEMIHLALPNIRRQHVWLSEGISTYVEGIARVQAGNRAAADVWSELLRALPQGLPRAGDRGLDHTHTWGRTYWGGALFCLLADVRIRERTERRKGLQDALAAVATASRDDSSIWPIDRVLRIGDAATETTVLIDLYTEMKDEPTSPDLDALWASLGVVRTGTTVHLNDAAPRAAIRRRIMSPRAAETP